MAMQIKREATAFSLSPASGQKRPRVTSDEHLRWIRTLPCILTGRDRKSVV